MGAWGHGIMESDPALDALLDIEGIIGGKVTKELLEKHESELRAGLSTRDYIKWQVLGQMIVETGARMRKDTLQHSISACRDRDLDSWVDPQKRQAALDQLRAALEAMIPGCRLGTNLKPNPDRYPG